MKKIIIVRWKAGEESPIIPDDSEIISYDNNFQTLEGRIVCELVYATKTY